MNRSNPNLLSLAAFAAAMLVLTAFRAQADDSDFESQGNSKGSMSGVVYVSTGDDQSTTPVAHALIVAVRYNNAADPYGNPNRPIAMTETDDDGEWSLPDMPSGNFVVTATAPGHFLARSTRLHIKPGTHHDLVHYLVEADLEPDDNPGTFTGQVIRLKKQYGGDDDDDTTPTVTAVSLTPYNYDDDGNDDDHPTTGQVFEPIEGAYVTTFAFEQDDGGHVDVDMLPVTGQAKTDDDGRFAINPLNPGLHMVVAQAVRHRPTVTLADIGTSMTTEGTILIVRAGDNPSTFPTVQWLKRDSPGHHNQQAQWSHQVTNEFTPPLPGQRDGWLTLRATNNRNTFGYWQSQEGWLHRFPGSLYQVNFVVGTDQPDPGDSPGVRLRANSSSLQQTDVMRISSLGDAGLAPTQEGRAYDLFFEPMDTDAFLPRGLDRINLSFDILNFDADDAYDGEVRLQSLDIDIHSLNGIETEMDLGSWTFDTGPEGWEAHEDIPPFDSAEARWEDGALVLKVHDEGNTFAYWSSPSDGFAAPEAGSLIRAAFAVHSDEGDPRDVATLRVRLNSGDSQVAVSKVVPSTGEAYNSPDMNGRIYRIYFQVPPALAGQPLVFSIDVLGFDSNDADDTALYLDDVKVDKIQLPDDCGCVTTGNPSQ